MTARQYAMDVLDVVAELIATSPGGFAAVAARLGVSEKILRNKVSRYNETHHLTLHNFISINQDLWAQPFSDRALQALCFEFGGVFMPLPELSNEIQHAPDMVALLSAVKETGEAMAACGGVLQPGQRLTEAQYQQAERECLEAFAALRVLMVRLRERRV